MTTLVIAEPERVNIYLSQSSRRAQRTMFIRQD